MRYFSGLNMGEGVAGGQQIAISTSQIYSCMGVAFANTRTGWGGLYHYPAGRADSYGVAETMRQMYNDVKPDIVVITPAGNPNQTHGIGSTQQDIANLVQLLLQMGAAPVFAAQNSTGAQLSWNNGLPVFEGEDFSDLHDAYVPAAVRRQPCLSGRLLRAGVWYYGGDGEVGPVYAALTQ